MREIIVDYTAPGLTGALSVFYFDDTFDVDLQRGAIDQMFTDFDTVLSNDLSWAVRSTGRELNPVNGELTGEWTSSIPVAGSGSGAGSELANATCLLLKWNTGVIQHGRFVRGRTYVPGVASSACVDGQVASSAVAQASVALTTFIGANLGFVIWHRPIPATDEDPGRSGNSNAVDAGSVWHEFAVQRRRR